MLRAGVVSLWNFPLCMAPWKVLAYFRHCHNANMALRCFLLVIFKSPMSLPYASLASVSVEDMKVHYCTLSSNVCAYFRWSGSSVLCCGLRCRQKELRESCLALALEPV